MRRRRTSPGKAGTISAATPPPRGASTPFTPNRPTPRPGTLFCNSALLHYHAIAIPALNLSAAPAEARLWVRPAPGSHHPVLCEVRNTLNFCFSIYPFRFKVLEPLPGVFETVACNGNIARLIISSGRCRLGRVSLLFFPSLSSAVDADFAGLGATNVNLTSLNFQNDSSTRRACGPAPGDDVGYTLVGRCGSPSPGPRPDARSAKGHCASSPADGPSASPATGSACIQVGGRDLEIRCTSAPHSPLSAAPSFPVPNERPIVSQQLHPASMTMPYAPTIAHSQLSSP